MGPTLYRNNLQHVPRKVVEVIDLTGEYDPIIVEEHVFASNRAFFYVALGGVVILVALLFLFCM